ncbi:UDP-N-acetylglucosamine--peptide N-acetylglucosaminyltransferase 110 kDa subunit isoform X2 [Folsomia candida]|nr:UDP-N-acetylglucosamine--peptide N-acetylglucosaminyltransferase 110 kDa subunit isoform X2 [Folsomia candida]XP_021948694.1 UDP-N-acetylglucosamine--peptide N-acetylglucosaminyltransferase 110 kDa subunit isoform X2 [Folsomia candida]XP_021948696.1 UDP-N-acetylglucosamine--peptide N-acetylglucosaminyltransferase 110 kDa subunit isoform X2 [Folsomia candida]XP_035705744.1 UDP-N-acetylglucosamine--peptide N-acetylglucosaminyltransferase 110 kDa subunit isoform X2 [Folsomia candida]
MKEGEHIRELIADGRLVDARDAANDFLSTFRDEPFMSSLLLCIKSDLAEWGDEYDQLRERVKNHFRMVLMGGCLTPRDVCGLFDDWKFLFNGLFDGEDILLLTRAYWVYPDIQEENDLAKNQPPRVSRKRAVKQLKKNLKIGYMSSFYNHPLGQLFCGIPNGHDKQTCTVIGLYTCMTQNGTYRTHTAEDEHVLGIIEDGCDNFYEIKEKTAAKIAKTIKNLGLDVLVALDGIMSDGRLDILQYNVAPVTCTVLGFPCTTGCPYVNYFVVDDIVCNPSHVVSKFSERLAFMSTSCYVGSHATLHTHLSYVHRVETALGEKFVMSASFIMPGIFKSKRGVSACWNFLKERHNSGVTNLFGHKIYDGSSRHYPLYSTTILDGITLTARFHYSLPEGNVVFATFNAIWKIDHELFSIWMRILDNVPSSVLWINTNSENDTITSNLRTAAGPALMDRLFFTPGVGHEEHVRRGSLVDVFLDTRVCNGHTTSLNALWTGSVIVAFPGKEFHNRVTCTLLHALRLQCLCCRSVEEYEQTAILLGLHTNKIEFIQREMQERKLRSTVFDTKQFAPEL